MRTERKVNLLVGATPFCLYLLAKFYHALANNPRVRGDREQLRAERRFFELVPLGGEYLLFYDYLCKVLSISLISISSFLYSQRHSIATPCPKL